MSRNKRKLRSRKAGLPPGALVHIGEIKTPAPSLSLIDFSADSFAEYPSLDLAALDHIPRGASVRWLNVYGLNDPQLLAAIGERFGLHPLVIEDVLNTDQRAKVEDYEDYLFVVLHLYDAGRDRYDMATDQVSLVIGRDFVVTFQERPSGAFAPLRQRLRPERSMLRRNGSDYLAYSLLDTVVDGYFSVVERLSERAEALEEQILGHSAKESLADIHQLKRDVTQLRRTIWPLREMLGSLLRGYPDFFQPATQIYLRDVHDHTVHILESLDDLRELLTGLLDVYLTTLSNRVNLEVRKLSVIATIFMPATLIAGIFGMNFEVMPWVGRADGFSLALILMAGVGLTMTLLFWYRRFLR